MGNSDLIAAARRYFDIFRSSTKQAALGLDGLCFPSVCSYCDVDLYGQSEVCLCDDCLAKLNERPTHRCPKCSARCAETFQDGECPWCRDHDFRFDRAYCVGSYSGDVREAILQLKHPRQEALATTMARLLIQRHAPAWEAAEVDVVVPIPMYWWRCTVQGHNGPDLTAALIAKSLGVYDYPRLLVRRRATRPQAGLSRPQRRDNVHNAFALRRGYRIDGAKVLLVDDILTTGATCSEAARTLKRAGAVSVDVAILGRAQSEV
ncbi:MAG: ComF family protein [Pirellulales bacterium]